MGRNLERVHPLHATGLITELLSKESKFSKVQNYVRLGLMKTLKAEFVSELKFFVAKHENERKTCNVFGLIINLMRCATLTLTTHKNSKKTKTYCNLGTVVAKCMVGKFVVTTLNDYAFF